MLPQRLRERGRTAHRRIAQEHPRPLLHQLIGQRDKLPCLLLRCQRCAGGKIIDGSILRLPGLKAVEHHTIGKKLEVIQRQDVAPAALAAADITVGLQQIIRLFHRGNIDLIFPAHKPIRRRRLSGCDLAGEDLRTQLGINLLIQALTAVPVQFKLLHPHHAVAIREMTRFGGVVSFEMGSFEEAKKVLNHVHLCALAVSLGDCETLIQHPASMTHSMCTKEEIEAAGFSDRLIRLAVGLEDSDDIIADLQQAFEAAQN